MASRFFACLRVAVRAILFPPIVAACLQASQGSGDAAAAIAAALRTKDYDQAVQLARSALDQSPKDFKILTLEAFAFSGLGKNEQAIAAYDAALKVAPDYLPALEGAAQIEYNTGSDRAVSLLNRILKSHPDDPTSHAMLGALAYKRNDCKAAVEHFRASSDLISSQRAALDEYGFCLVSLDRAKDAVPIYRRVLSWAMEDPQARLHLAAAQSLADQPQDAIATLQPVLAEGNPNPEVLQVASAAFEKTGDTSRAVELLRKAIVSQPDNPKYYLALSTLCFDHSSFQVGIDVLNLGLTRLPDSAPLYLARGILFIQLGQYDKGQADFEAADRLDPRQAFSSESEGLAKLQASNPDEALATVRTRLKNHPDDAFLHYLLAEILDQRAASVASPQFHEAVQSASKAVQLRPDLILAHDLLSGFYLKSGEIERATEECRLALRYDPSDQVALYHLTQALRKSGKRDEIPDLLKRLANLREQSRENEQRRSQYKLVEIPTPEDENL